MADSEAATGGSRVVPDDDFDPTLVKKKKKKKKVPAEFLEEGAAPAATEAPKEETPAPAADEVDDPYAIVDDEVLAKKKKKKKKPVVDGDAEPAAEGAAAEAGADGDDLMLTKKKKKKKKVLLDEEGGEEEEDVDAGLDQQFEKKKKKKKKKKKAEEETPVAVSDDAPKAEDSLPWAGSDRDYTYNEMLTRVQRILQERNPSLAAGERRRFLMKPPKVVREGTKKTVFLNFAEICKIMNRDLQHVYQFILVELGTSGSIDGSQRMVIKGRFQPKAIENILRRYVVEYLTCHSCKSPDTILKKDDRLFFLVCNQCGAQRSVATIKQGFQAQIGKRKKM